MTNPFEAYGQGFAAGTAGAGMRAQIAQLRAQQMGAAKDQQFIRLFQIYSDPNRPATDRETAQKMMMGISPEKFYDLVGGQQKLQLNQAKIEKNQTDSLATQFELQTEQAKSVAKLNGAIKSALSQVQDQESYDKARSDILRLISQQPAQIKLPLLEKFKSYFPQNYNPDQIKAIDNALALDTVAYGQAPKTTELRQAFINQGLARGMNQADAEKYADEQLTRIAREGKVVKIQKEPDGFQFSSKELIELRTAARDTQALVVAYQDILNQAEKYPDQFRKLFATNIISAAQQLGSRLVNQGARKINLSVDISLFEDAQLYRYRVNLDTRLKQLFDMYRKKITGAAASVQELNSLKDSMPVLEGDYESFISKLRTAVVKGQEALRAVNVMLQTKRLDISTELGKQETPEFLTQGQRAPAATPTISDHEAAAAAAIGEL